MRKTLCEVCFLEYLTDFISNAFFCLLLFFMCDNETGMDSFITFEEILANAVKHNVDFVLLGGDLFHDAKPSPNALNRYKFSKAYLKICLLIFAIIFQLHETSSCLHAWR